MSEVFDPEKVERFEGDVLHAAMESGSVNVMVTSYVRTADYLKLLALYREAVRRRDADRRTALNDLARAEFADGSYEGMPIPERGSDM